MKTYILVILSVCVCVTSGYRIKQQGSRKVDRVIEYVSKDRKAANIPETITIQDQEVRLSIKGGMVAILDYSQMLLFVKRSDKKDSCIATSFKDLKQVPSLESITEMIKEHKGPFEMPTVSVKLHLQKSKQQQRPNLSPLSEELCGEHKIQILEPKPDNISARSAETAVALRHRLRPKRDVGVSEVLLIVLIIVLL